MSWWGGRVVFTCICMMPAGAFSQGLVLGDSMVPCSFYLLTGSFSLPVKMRIAQDIEYTLSCSNLISVNRQRGPDIFQFSLLQHLLHQAQITSGGKIKIASSFVHDLGLQYFFDSIFRFQPDENTWVTRLELTLFHHVIFSLYSQLTTRLFNAYTFEKDPSGTLHKTLNAAFLTPLLWTFSAGFGWTIPRFATLGFGLASAKITYIRNRGIYDQLHVSTFYGVAKGKNHLFEYGLNMHLLIDHEFKPRIHWNCDVLMFQNYHKPVDLVMNNLVGIKINKYLKTVIQTHLSYESAVCRNLQVENMISVGLSFTF